KADRQIDPQGDLAGDLLEVEHLIGCIEAEMDHHKSKGGDADHPPHLDQLLPLRIWRSGATASARKIRRIVHRPIWWIASFSGRAPSRSRQYAAATQM